MAGSGSLHPSKQSLLYPFIWGLFVLEIWPTVLGGAVADKREIRDFPKLPPATSFIRAPLYSIPPPRKALLKRLFIIAL